MPTSRRSATSTTKQPPRPNKQHAAEPSNSTLHETGSRSGSPRGRKTPTPGRLQPSPDAPPHRVRKRLPSNVDATLGELETFPEAIQVSSTARLALEMARALDSKCSAAQKAMCAQRHTEAMTLLREKVPPALDKDEVDELTERRRSRLARRSGA